MKPEFRKLRIAQLERALKPFLAVKDSPRPQKGWIRAIREATGVTLREMAKRLGKVPSLALYLENSEADYRITLGNLREAAEALDCQLVYAFVPKGGSVQSLSEKRARAKATENVRAVEHTMALEDQAVGGVEDKIEQETKRILKRSPSERHQ
jgi:predicted DNA-binding mobile mystery protein A